MKLILAHPVDSDEASHARFMKRRIQWGLSAKHMSAFHTWDVTYHRAACRLPPNYPHAEAILRLKDHQGLTLGDQRALSKQLHAAVAGFAAEGAVCAFDLINACQAFLQERNASAVAQPDAAPVSTERPGNAQGFWTQGTAGELNAWSMMPH